MKTLYKLLIVLLVCFSSTANAQLKLDYEGLFFGEKQYTPVYVGKGWAVEVWEGGFNFWKPWPSVNSGNYKLFFDSYNKVGIGKVPTTHALEIDGDLMVQGPVYTSSDIRLKSNINDLSDMNSLSLLGKINAKSYTKKQAPTILNIDAEIEKLISSGKIEKEDVPAVKMQLQNEQNKTDDRIEIGFLAHEIQEIFPNLVHENKDGYLSVDYIGLIPVLLQSIKELQSEIEQQSAAIDKANSLLINEQSNNL